MQGTAERRIEIMKVLCRRRYETISNLAFEFGVSERTIRRDIEILSISEPIYTQAGRYGGGVYVVGNYSMSRMYMTDEEMTVLRKIEKAVNNCTCCDLDDREKETLHSLIEIYTKPKIKKGA